MGGPGVALVVFNRNRTEGVRRILSSVGPIAAERLVIDSSEPRFGADLAAVIRSADAECVRVFPTGYPEVFRHLAWKRSRAVWILCVDTDEEVSPELLEALPELCADETVDAYDIPRWERSLRAYSFQLRLYRKGCVDFRGWIHESPGIRGSRRTLRPPQQLVHTADLRRYLSDVERGESYLTAETFERPCVAVTLTEEFRSRMARRLLGDSCQMPSRWVVALLAGTMPFRKYNPHNSAGGNLRTGRYLARYFRARAERFRGISRSARDEAVAIALELRKAGGPVAYLGLGDENYAKALTDSFPWNWSGSQALQELLTHRFRTGERLLKWSE